MVDFSSSYTASKFHKILVKVSFKMAKTKGNTKKGSGVPSRGVFKSKIGMFYHPSQVACFILTLIPDIEQNRVKHRNKYVPRIQKKSNSNKSWDWSFYKGSNESSSFDFFVRSNMNLRSRKSVDIAGRTLRQVKVMI